MKLNFRHCDPLHLLLLTCHTLIYSNNNFLLTQHQMKVEDEGVWMVWSLNHLQCWHMTQGAHHTVNNQEQVKQNRHSLDKYTLPCSHWLLHLQCWFQCLKQSPFMTINSLFIHNNNKILKFKQINALPSKFISDACTETELILIFRWNIWYCCKK